MGETTWVDRDPETGRHHRHGHLIELDGCAREAFVNIALSVWSNTCNAYCGEQDATHAPECHLAATLYHAAAPVPHPAATDPSDGP